MSGQSVAESVIAMTDTDDYHRKHEKRAEQGVEKKNAEHVVAVN